MPGHDKCCVCEHELESKESGERLYPVRASERPFWSRIWWRIRETGFLMRYDQARAGIRYTGARIGFAELLWLLASAVPGVGHIYILKRRRIGLYMLCGTILAAVLAVLFYRSPISNLLGLGIVTASVISVFSVLYKYLDDYWSARDRKVNAASVAMIVFSFYALSYFLLVMAFYNSVFAVNVNIPVYIPEVSDGDRILVIREDGYGLGDAVVGSIEYNEREVLALGCVLGVSGDIIELKDGLYVNGKRAAIQAVPVNYDVSSYVEGQAAIRHVLWVGEDELWVPPSPGWIVGNPDNWLDAGRIKVDAVRGRAAAVIEPPEHRCIVRRLKGGADGTD